MTQYVISIKDETKANYVFALLNDLAYIDISKKDVQPDNQAVRKKRLPSEIITPINVENFKLFNREELNER